MTKFGPVYKWLVAVVGALAVATSGLWDDGAIRGVAEYCALATALAGVVTTWLIPELRAGLARHAKGLVAVVIAVASLLPGLALDGHLDLNDKVALVVAALTALGILGAPNPGYIRAHKTAGPVVPDQR